MSGPDPGSRGTEPVNIRMSSEKCVRPPVVVATALS
jgi:hypothetical protein